MTGMAPDAGDLLAMADEGHPAYGGRSSSEAEQLRAWAMASAAKAGMADRLVGRALADLETALSPVSLAAAAVVLRHASAAPPRAEELLKAARSRLGAHDRMVDLSQVPPQPGGVSATAEIERAIAALASRRELPALAAGCGCGCDHEPPGPGALPDLAAFAGLGVETEQAARMTLAEVLGAGSGLLAFFYTRCMNPLRCSRTVSELGLLARTLAGLPGADRVRVAGMSYDPGYDTAERLLAYGQDRSVGFGKGCRLLRATSDFAPVAAALALGVGYGPATVNQHRLEWLVFGPGLKVVRVGAGRHWDAGDMAQELIALLDP